MSKKDKNKKKRGERRKASPQIALMIDYYQLPFYMISSEMIKQGYDGDVPRPLRSSFWSLMPEGAYDPIEARGLVESYLIRVEQELQTVISRQSIAYWLHLYRRVGMGVTGRNDTPATIYNVRAIFEAAVQKFANQEPCNRIGVSTQVPPESILAGILMVPELERFRKAATSNAQLVLTDFSTNEMRELYDTEKLAYEVWKCMATMRIIGKGAKSYR